MDEFIRSLAVGVVSGGLASTIIGLLFRGRVLRMEEDIKNQIKIQYEKSLSEFQAMRSWKERSITQLLGPLYMQFDRTARAFVRWQAGDLYIEAKVVREGNVAIRDLLLTKGDLIPAELRDDAGRLVEHYDRWLEEFDQVRNAEKPGPTEPFVFVGTQGYPFPRDSELRFRETFKNLWTELYAKPAQMLDAVMRQESGPQ